LFLDNFTNVLTINKKGVSVPQLEVEAPVETVVQECYQAIIEKRTITLTVDVNNVNQFEGELDYSYYQKDKSFGTVFGNVKGDTVFADYTFQSEGKTSVRELVFLKKDGDTFVKGYGEILETNGENGI